MNTFPTSSPKEEILRCVAIAGIAAVTSGLSLLLREWLLGAIGVFLAFGYIGCILFAAAYRSDVKHKSLGKQDSSGEWKSDLFNWGFPTRTGGIVVVFLILVMIVAGFAGMYLEADITVNGHELNTVGEALYFSFATFSTLGHWSYSLNGIWPHILVSLEVFGGMLSLVLLFALLVARLSTW